MKSLVVFGKGIREIVTTFILYLPGIVSRCSSTSVRISRQQSFSGIKFPGSEFHCLLLHDDWMFLKMLINFSFGQTQTRDIVKDITSGPVG